MVQNLATSLSTESHIGGHERFTPSDNTQHERSVKEISKDNISNGKYPRWIGRKFDPDGHALSYPGNTIICHLPSKSVLYTPLLALYNELSKADFASLYTLLPPSSWHMTVFEGVVDEIRKPGAWPDDLPLDTPLPKCHDLFQRKLSQFHLEAEPPFRMAVSGWKPLKSGISLRVVPVDSAEEKRLRNLRDRLSETLRIRDPGHDGYVFHITIAYLLRRLSREDCQKIEMLQEKFDLPQYFELGAPEFCLFDDMFAFRRQFLLGSSTK